LSEEERAQLMERLREAEQSEQSWRKITAESQAEAAVYRDLLEDCYEAARQARANNDLSLLSKVNTLFLTTPSKQDVKRWGKYFLDAYMRDARWLRDTKKALELIKAEAEKLLEDNTTNAELKKKIENIIKVADEGLIEHI
jgi:hypothetical protein